MFSNRSSVSHGSRVSSLAAKAAIAGAALAFTVPVRAGMLVNVVLGWGPAHMAIPTNGTVAAAPSTGSNEWNGFGANGAQPYSISFNPLDANGSATNITGTFVETNPTSQGAYFVTATNGEYMPSGGILPPFVNFPAATWEGVPNTEVTSQPFGPDTLTLTGLNSTGSYDVYVYSAYAEGVATSTNTPTVSVTLTKGTAATASYTYTYNMNDPNLLASYQLGTNYEEFQNVVPDSTGTIAIAETGANTSLFNAFQIYSAAPVPEPATMGLFGIGVLGLLLIKRRHASRQAGGPV